MPLPHLPRISIRPLTHVAATVLCAALALVVVVPGTASAALLAQFRTAVTGVSPSVPGVTAKSATNGESITVTNRSDTTLIVEGYQHEAYLKITKAGVWQNKVSPATYLNKEQTIGTLPSQASANKPAVWVKISSSPVATWHDHRIHWMGSQDPPVTQSDPHHSHLINKWTIPTRYGKQKGSITGTLTWYPGTQWALIGVYTAIGLAIIATLVAVTVIGRRRRRAKAAPADR